MAIPRMIDHVGQVLGERYRLITPIGTGASASVYLGDDVILRRRVAVKVLHAALADDEAFLRRFRAEAQAAAALNHPHVLAVHDWGHDGDVPYLVTEFLGGGSLRALLDADRRLSLSQALLVGLETARGLEYAHRNGFVHRDIKPANLIFDEEGRLRIADFGLARALAEAAWTEPMGTVLGTARYASPEQARGEQLDSRSDVYSLAVAMIESVTGAAPFASDTTLGTLMARVDKPLPVPEEMGPLVQALEAAGTPDPKARPDAAAFGLSLIDLAHELPRPDPLPLVGTLSSRESLADRDPTAIAGATPISVVSGGTAADRERAGGPVPGGPSDPDASDPEVPDWVSARESLAGVDVARVAAGDDVVVEADAPGDAISIGAAPRATAPGDVDGSLSATDAADDEGELDGTTADEASPRSRWRWVRWVVLALVAAAAAMGLAVALLDDGGSRGPLAAVLPAPTVALPDLVGTDGAELEALAAEHDWDVVSDQAYDDAMAEGLIASQDPVAGTELEDGSTVSIVVSLGPSPVPVPADLVGRSIDDATAALAEVGFELGPVAEWFDEEVPAGVVMAVLPAAPAQMPPGRAVAVTISAGPEPRTVPEGLAGRSIDGVRADLEALGLVVATAEDYNDSVAAGNVMWVDPGPGTQVPRGGQVLVGVSLGPPLVVVPDVSTLSVFEAATQLEAIGLVVASTSGSPTRPVSYTTPAAGESVRIGTSITIVAG